MSISRFRPISVPPGLSTEPQLIPGGVNAAQYIIDKMEVWIAAYRSISTTVSVSGPGIEPFECDYKDAGAYAHLFR